MSPQMLFRLSNFLISNSHASGLHDLGRGRKNKCVRYASVLPASSLVLCCISLPYNLLHVHVQLWPTESLMVYDFDIFFPAYTVEISFFVFFLFMPTGSPRPRGAVVTNIYAPPPTNALLKSVHCLYWMQ